MQKWADLLKSRRFWAAAVAFVAVISPMFGVEIDQQTGNSIVSGAVVVAGWLISQGMRPTGKIPPGALH